MNGQTIDAWLAAQSARFADAAVARWELRALVTLCTGLNPVQQRLHAAPLADEVRAQLDALAERLLAGEPLGYLLGTQDFWDVTLKVTPATLIPRADTEAVVERALQLCRPFAAPVVYDLGTGSGAIAIVIARHCPRATVVASDISPAALAVARENAARCGVDNVRFVQGDWFQPYADESADVVISNPPYIAPDDPHLPALRYEPQGALVATRDGYGDLERLICDAPRVVRAGGWLLLEHGYQQGERVAALAADSGAFGAIKTFCDRAGRPRWTEMQKLL